MAAIERAHRRIERAHRRVAFCECGARLAGDTEQELFEAAQRHLAHHHPELVGALELETVLQMSEDVGRAPGGRAGAARPGGRAAGGQPNLDTGARAT